MSAKISRPAVRCFHLAAGAVLGAYVYSPLGDEPWFRLTTQAVVLPLVTLSGLWLWLGPRVQVWRRRRTGHTATAATTPAGAV